jgi:hypothetical protein
MERGRASMPSNETYLFADDPEPEIKQPRRSSPQIENLLDWLVNHWAKPTVTAREIYTYGPNSIRNKKTTLSLTEVLVEDGWLIPTETHQRNKHHRFLTGSNRCYRREWKIVKGPILQLTG